MNPTLVGVGVEVGVGVGSGVGVEVGVGFSVGVRADTGVGDGTGVASTTDKFGGSVTVTMFRLSKVRVVFVRVFNTF